MTSQSRSVPAQRTGPSFLNRWPIAYPRHAGDWTLRRPGPIWARLDPESGAVATVDPARDPCLPALGASLGRGELIGYRVGRRAVVATPNSFIKVVRQRRIDRLAEIHGWLARACQDVRFPEVLNTDAAGSIELAALPGVSLHQYLRSSGSEPELAKVLDATAAALAKLHGTRPGRQIEAQRLDDPRRWVATAAQVEPGAEAELSLVAGGLPPLRARPRVVVHGDLHDKNIVVSPTGVGLIDVDGAGLGDPADDLANLAVHLQLRCLQAELGPELGEARAHHLYRAYEILHPLDRARVQAVERHTWFRLACIYRFRARGRRFVPELLHRAKATSSIWA